MTTEPQPAPVAAAALTVTDLTPEEQLVLQMAREQIRDGRDLPLQVAVALANALEKAGRGSAVLRGMAAERERECRRIVGDIRALAGEWEDRAGRLHESAGSADAKWPQDAAVRAELYEILANELRELADDPGGAAR